MTVIKVQKIPQKKVTAQDLIAQFCYHFPQYTFEEARKMPVKRINHMLKIATKEQAKILSILLAIVSAPHTKDGGKSLKENLNAIINE